MLKFYCPECEKNVQAQNLSCKKDDRHGRIWGELHCIECHHILLTFTSDEEGELGIKKHDDYEYLLRQLFYTRLALGNKVEDIIRESNTRLWDKIYKALRHKNE